MVFAGVALFLRPWLVMLLVPTFAIICAEADPCTVRQGVPKSGESFIDFIGHVHKTKVQFGLDGPITVHCRYDNRLAAVFLRLLVWFTTMTWE